MSRLPNSAAPRVIFGVMGLAFLGIGLTTIVSLWAAPFGDFMSPPLMFRIFGSFIAIVFVVFGGTFAWGSFFGGSLSRFQPQDHEAPRGAGGNYTCPKCGAPLEDGAEVSPRGDVKCRHCGGWYNVH